MVTAITIYDAVLCVHILAVVVAFGVVFAYPVIDAQIRNAGPGSATRGSARRSRSSSSSSGLSAPC